MKKAILIGLLFVYAQCASAQRTFDGTTDNLMILSGGFHELFISNTAFNAWTAANYNKHISAPFGGNIDLMFINFKNYDIGGNFSWNSLYGFGSGYIGRRLTAPGADIASWLNVDIGSFYANYKNEILPLNYTPTPDQAGKMLELHYTSTYIGLTSKNYLTKKAIRLGKRWGAVFIPSVFFSVGYEPFKNSSWKYGYYYIDPSDTSRHFRWNTIRNIPKLSNVFFNAGISLAVAGKQ